MDPSAENGVFNNTLLFSKIFSNFDTPTLQVTRHVCRHWAAGGGDLLKGRSRYFKLIDSSDHNKKEIRELNIQRLQWLSNFLETNDDSAWIIQRLQIPLREAIECRQVGEFLATYGHLITDLRIVKYDRFWKGNALCMPGCPEIHDVDLSLSMSPSQFLHNVLTLWCPNLTELAAMEYKLEDVAWTGSLIFQPFDIDPFCESPYFKLKVLRFRFTLHSFRSGFELSINFLTKLFSLCPNLIEVDVQAPTRTVDIEDTEGQEALLDTLIVRRESYGFDKGLEKLRLGTVIKRVGMVNWITTQKYPKLTELDLGVTIQWNPFDLPNYDGRLDHPGVKKVSMVADIHDMEGVTFDKILEIFPHVSSLNFVNELWIKKALCCVRHRFFIRSSTLQFPNFKELRLELRLIGNIPQVLENLGELVPKLETLELKWLRKPREGVDENYDFVELVHGILGRMRNLKRCVLGVAEKEQTVRDWVREQELDQIVPNGIKFQVFYGLGL